MERPIILITGSTSGIGKATAIALAKTGAEVILHGRSAKKGSEAQQQVKKESGGEAPSLLIADHSDQSQIHRLAADVALQYSRLDVLINNAGIYERNHRLTPEGVEMTFAVNYIAPFLLTHRLLPLLQKSAPSRIVNVASTAHEDIDRIDFDNLPAMNHYDPWRAYSLTKFADITFTYELARKLAGTGISVNCLHPGVVDTKLLRGAFPGIPGIPPEEGARTSVYLAISPELAGVSGKYFVEQRPARSAPLTCELSVQEQFWKIAKEVTGISGT